MRPSVRLYDGECDFRVSNPAPWPSAPRAAAVPEDDLQVQGLPTAITGGSALHSDAAQAAHDPSRPKAEVVGLSPTAITGSDHGSDDHGSSRTFIH